MTYKVEYTKTAVKQLKKMDKKIAAFILSYIEDKLVNSSDPRVYGKSLQGNLGDKWRYRVGGYRMLAKIEDDKVVITIVEIGHRRDVYD
ncbi:UNVERIFIED_CONTAM: mRNA interferase RelE/StbE [Acetivibrio alkalicellulosi]